MESLASSPTRLVVEKELAKGAEASVISLVNGLLYEAHTLRASDIHIDPSAKAVKVRLRIDGVLQTLHEFPKSIHSEVISRVKVLAGLRTDEHAASQDGRFRHTFADSQEFIDMRVSIVPTYHGENVVMRLLSDKAEHYTLDMLGFSAGDQKKILAAIQ